MQELLLTVLADSAMEGALRGAVIGAVVGGLAGAVFFGIKKLSNKDKPRE